MSYLILKKYLTNDFLNKDECSTIWISLHIFQYKTKDKKFKLEQKLLKFIIIIRFFLYPAVGGCVALNACPPHPIDNEIFLHISNL
jgi:hypothetical protein